MNKDLLAVAKGLKPADLVIQNGKIVNVYSGEIYDGGVAVCGDTIAAVGDVAYCVGENTRVVDAGGKYRDSWFPGWTYPPREFFSGHPAFAEAVLAPRYYRYHDRPARGGRSLWSGGHRGHFEGG